MCSVMAVTPCLSGTRVWRIIQTTRPSPSRTAGPDAFGDSLCWAWCRRGGPTVLAVKSSAPARPGAPPLCLDVRLFVRLCPRLLLPGIRPLSARVQPSRVQGQPPPGSALQVDEGSVFADFRPRLPVTGGLAFAMGWIRVCVQPVEASSCIRVIMG